MGILTSNFVIKCVNNNTNDEINYQIRNKINTKKVVALFHSLIWNKTSVLSPFLYPNSINNEDYLQLVSMSGTFEILHSTIISRLNIG